MRKERRQRKGRARQQSAAALQFDFCFKWISQIMGRPLENRTVYNPYVFEIVYSIKSTIIERETVTGKSNISTTVRS